MFNFISSGKHIICVNDNLSVVLTFHNMVLDLKFFRYENTPWGFRLSGGSDFDYPLTVIKVTEGSIAEDAGMKVGDVVVRVNETAISNLNHGEAHDLIMTCGNNFMLYVIRPDAADGENVNEIAEQQTNATADTDTADNKNNNDNKCDNFLQQIQSPDSHAYSNMSQISLNSMITELSDCKSDENSEKIIEEHIAEIMSGEAEVLKEHNVLGVNFQKIMPKAGMFKSSEVFKQLNEEAIKTKAEKDKEIKKWTTFLQKPNRPIPKSKFQLEFEAKKAQLGYRVKICKQPKPRCAPNRTPTPPAEPIIEPEPIDVNTSIELVPGPEPQYVEYLNDEHNTNDAANNSELSVVEDANVDNSTEENLQIENNENNNKDIASEETENDCANEEPDVVVEEENIVKTEEELFLENQLISVQKQLLQLSTLPSTIQATLDAVTKQLADLVPGFRLQNSIISEKNNEICKIEEKITCETKVNGAETEIADDGQEHMVDVKHQMDDIKIENDMDEEIHQDTDAIINDVHENNEIHVEDKSTTVIDQCEIDDSTETRELIESQKMEKVFRKQEEEWLRKRQKEQNKLREELEQRIITQRIQKRSPKSLGGPLTPQERPLVLPGGRKWRNEKDAYNEEFIAEIISSQAELITGTTLGINFSKYKKPEKDLSNLNRSEVFKMIHHIENEPKHGISVRPPKVMAADDIQNYNSSVSCG